MVGGKEEDWNQDVVSRDIWIGPQTVRIENEGEQMRGVWNEKVPKEGNSWRQNGVYKGWVMKRAWQADEAGRWRERESEMKPGEGWYKQPWMSSLYRREGSMEGAYKGSRGGNEVTWPSSHEWAMGWRWRRRRRVEYQWGKLETEELFTAKGTHWIKRCDYVREDLWSCSVRSKKNWPSCQNLTYLLTLKPCGTVACLSSEEGETSSCCIVVTEFLRIFLSPSLGSVFCFEWIKYSSKIKLFMLTVISVFYKNVSSYVCMISICKWTRWFGGTVRVSPCRYQNSLWEYILLGVVVHCQSMFS